uniref:Uncharacterized protein n=1 Tax=Oryza sativa subsp. japonica TaxID=39947 RepID=Q6YYB6_ORYSJ|nr:hypothetical protein [Oryza sativa Japonica Group]BAD16312.1 hypothetical protein [Oryza sativa Japonica Group]
MRRAHAQPHGSPRTMRTGEKRRELLAGSDDPVAAEVAPTWRLRGSHAGRREVDDDAGRNGRRTTAASGGANHGDTGESEHTGMTRKKERERANGLDSPEGARLRRISAAATGGEQRGKWRRGHEGPTPGGESIYAATGIRC